MAPRLLLDTHIVVRWLAEPKKLSGDQRRALELSANHQEPFAISAMTLLEIALLAEKKGGLAADSKAILRALEATPDFAVLPLTFAIANEIASLGPALRDPGDRTIVATARVHRLRLVTSDQRIINSKLVQTIE